MMRPNLGNDKFVFFIFEDLFKSNDTKHTLYSGYILHPGVELLLS